jgi:uncharacterized protein YlxW (UPF0749 family)
MKSQNIVIAAIWIFVLILTAGSVLLENIDGFALMMIFFIALIVSAVFMVFDTEKDETKKDSSESELLTELQSIRTKLDSLNKEVEDIKKTIEE